MTVLCTRRDILKTGLGTAIGLAIPSAKFGRAADRVRRDKHPVAAIVTAYHDNSHADVIVGKILDGYRQDGGARTRFDLDGELRRAMRRETEMLFAHIARENLSVLDLIDSDYTFVNAKLGLSWGRSELALYANNITNVRPNLGDFNPESYAKHSTDPSQYDAGYGVGYIVPRVATLRPVSLGLTFRQRF